MPLQSFYQDITLMDVTSFTKPIAYMLFSEMMSVVTHVLTVTDFGYVQYKPCAYKAKENGCSLMFIPCISDVLEGKTPTICTDCTFLYLFLRVGSYMFRQ
jgi:hypothetical protein